MVAILLLVFLIIISDGIIESKETNLVNQTAAYSSDLTKVTNEDVPSTMESVYRKGEPCSNESDFCHPWGYCDDKGDCTCGEAIYKLKQCVKITLQDNICITYNHEKHLLEMGRCIYSFRNDGDPFPDNVSELNDHVCGKFNRAGTLCGRCKNGYYPLAYSFDIKCVKCPHKEWWRYLLAAYLPLTFFYFFILLFKVNVTSSLLFIFVFFSQIISIPMMARIMFIANRSNDRHAIQYALRNLESGFLSFTRFKCVSRNWVSPDTSP